MPNFFLPSKIFTSILWLSVIFLWSKSVQATENECGSVSSLELLSENEDCETKYIQGASYCCPDYQCCSEEEIRSAGNPCPCAGNQKCCDGKTCCTALEVSYINNTITIILIIIIKILPIKIITVISQYIVLSLFKLTLTSFYDCFYNLKKWQKGKGLSSGV